MVSGDQTEELIRRVIEYLRDQYRRTGDNKPVPWRPIAAELGVSEDQLEQALHSAFEPCEGQREIVPVDEERIRLGAAAHDRV